MKTDVEKKNKSTEGRVLEFQPRADKELDAQLQGLPIPLPRDLAVLACDFASKQSGKSYFSLQRETSGRVGVFLTVAFAVSRDGNLTQLVGEAGISTPSVELARIIAEDILEREPHPVACELLKEHLKSRVRPLRRYVGFLLGEAEVRAVLRDAAAEVRSKGALDCGSEGELLRAPGA